MLQDCRFTILLAYRSRALLALGLASVFLLFFTWVGFQFSGRQPQTVALDIGLSFIRFVVPLLGVLLAQEMIAREVERRLIFTSLTYPRSRTVFLLGRALAILALTIAALLSMTALLALWVWALGLSYDQGTPVSLGRLLVLVFVFNALDSLVVLAFSILLAVLATVPNLVLLLSLGFMIVARSWSAVVQLLLDDSRVMVGADQYRAGLGLLRYVLPDLGALDVRAVALYDRPQFLPVDAGWHALMAIAYAAILMALACWRFERRQFG